MKAIRRIATNLDEKIGNWTGVAREKINNLKPWALGFGAAAILATGSVLPVRSVEATPTLDPQVQTQTPSQAAFNTSLEDVVNGPQPTEQVKEAQPWTLTDEYGNTTIMDNDGIVLHLPSDLSLDQVSKVKWYRNNVLMRFIDPLDKVLELTNAEMKTFDGNHGEHSPASLHTDHAIAGYDYKVEVDFNDTLKILETTVRSTLKWNGKVWVSIGDNLTSYLYKLYPTPATLISIFNRLKDDNIYGIVIGIPYYVDSVDANEVKILDHFDNSIIPWYTATPSYRDLDYVIKAARSSGLQVGVRTHLYISKRSRGTDPIWSSFINPSSPALFFKNYGNLIVQLADFLEEEGVERLTPFAELDHLDKYPNLIKEFFTRVSLVFSGSLGYEVDTANILNGTSPAYSKSIPFWKAGGKMYDWQGPNGRLLDIVIDSSQPTLETQKDQRLSIMKENIKRFYLPAFSYYRLNYPNNRVRFGEIWALTMDGFAMGPKEYYSQVKYIEDYQEDEEKQTKQTCK